MSKTRRFRHVLTVLTVLAVPSSSYSTVRFQDEGTLAGWAHHLKDGGCSMTQVSSPTFKGSTALRHAATYSGSGDVSVHCEVALDPAFNVGDDLYYGWTFRLGTDLEPPVSEEAVIAQFGTRTPNCPWQQIDFIYITGNRFVDGTGFGDGCNPSGITHELGPVPSRNVWHRFVLRKIWREDPTGLLEIWLDGTRVLSTRQPTTYTNTSTSRNWHVGLYGGFRYGQAGTKTVWTDHMRMATTYAEAEPLNWGGGTVPTPTPTPTPRSRPTATPRSTPTPTPTPPATGFSGYYKLIARHSGKAVVVQSASTSNGANVFQWTYGGSATNDEWELRSIGSGYYRLIARHSGKDMNVSGASTSNTANVIQWPYSSTSPANDEWQPVSLGNGYHRIVARHSGKVLNVAGASTADGADVDQYSWANVNQQQFQIVSVP